MPGNGPFVDGSLSKALDDVLMSWFNRGRLRFRSTDDGSDDLFLTDELVKAAKPFIEAQADSLGSAWRRAVAALPEGWSIDRLVQIWPVGQGWWVGANRGDGSLERAEGPTPEAALDALAERLEEAKPTVEEMDEAESNDPNQPWNTAGYS